MAAPFDYDTFVMRNAGYVSAETQAKIRNTTLLIAGCGIGSGPAVCAARIGFRKFVLVDGDTVDAHNLNRQFYDFADIGKPKVDALKEKILRINPEAEVEAINAYLNAENTDQIIGKGQIVFDTVDFLDLEAIKAFERAQPFPNPPPAILAMDQTVRFQFGFFLELSGRPGMRLFRSNQ